MRYSKKLAVILSFPAFIWACGSNDSQGTSPTSTGGIAGSGGGGEGGAAGAAGSGGAVSGSGGAVAGSAGSTHGGGTTHGSSGAGSAGMPNAGGVAGAGVADAGAPPAPTIETVEPLEGGLHIMWTNATLDCDVIELHRSKDNGEYGLAFSLTGAAEEQHDETATAPGMYCYMARCIRDAIPSEDSNELCGSP